MKHQVTYFMLASCLALGSLPLALHAEENDKLQLSGFARVIMGYLDDANAEYIGYDNSVSFDQQSLIALQADYRFTDEISVTGQLVGNTGKQRDSGIEWLYLTYKPNKALQIKLGKLRIPFFNYSDSLDVGFAYPWLTLPQQFYDTAFFSTFEGVSANYEFTVKDWVINSEGFWGYYDDAFNVASRSVDAQVTGLFGVNTSAAYRGWSFRASFAQGDADVELPEATQFGEQLRQLGFNKNGDWLDPNGTIQFFQLSANYENVDYFVRSEVGKVVGKSGITPDINNFYISVGYNFNPYTLYISYGKRKVYYDHIPNEIPYGVSDGLNTLAATYDFVLTQFSDDKNNGTKLGIRWDWKSNIAFKGEMTLIEANGPISNDFSLVDLGNFDDRAILYQLGLEWVF